MDTLYYEDDCVYAVELFDRVEVRVEGITHEGEVRRIHPRSHEVTVRYDDQLDFYRTSGNPRRKTRRVRIAAVDLIGRDA